MITLVTTPNNLAYFRILSGPAWKENCAVSAKFSMGTRLRLHNIWEHCTCTDRQKKREKMNLPAFGCASRTRPFPLCLMAYLIGTDSQTIESSGKRAGIINKRDASFSFSLIVIVFETSAITFETKKFLLSALSRTMMTAV